MDGLEKALGIVMMLMTQDPVVRERLLEGLQTFEDAARRDDLPAPEIETFARLKKWLQDYWANPPSG